MLISRKQIELLLAPIMGGKAENVGTAVGGMEFGQWVEQSLIDCL